MKSKYDKKKRSPTSPYKCLFTFSSLVLCAGGSMFRLKGSILSMSFLDCNGALIPYSYEPWKDDNRSGDASRRDRKY